LMDAVAVLWGGVGLIAQQRIVPMHAITTGLVPCMVSVSAMLDGRGKLALSEFALETARLTENAPVVFVIVIMATPDLTAPKKSVPLIARDEVNAVRVSASARVDGWDPHAPSKLALTTATNAATVSMPNAVASLAGLATIVKSKRPLWNAPTIANPMVAAVKEFANATLVGLERVAANPLCWNVPETVLRMGTVVMEHASASQGSLAHPARSGLVLKAVLEMENA